MSVKVAIITPTYNRAYILDKLYESLLKQTCFDFVWYIIDDGSTDNTECKCKTFTTDKFSIIYYKKTNGGKHTALNFAIDRIEEELTFIVDSDDYLSDSAIETIISDWNNLKTNDVICGISYYKLKPDGSVVGDVYPHGETIDTYLNFRVNKNVTGDKAEVYRTDILKNHKFPEFEGEKFLSEAVVWNSISSSGYKLAFIEKGIYYCDYLVDGLTKSGRKYRLLNPLGTMEHAKSFLCSQAKFKIRVKYMMLYIATIYFSKMSIKDAFKKLDSYKFLFAIDFIPASLLALFWKRKYKI